MSGGPSRSSVRRLPRARHVSPDEARRRRRGDPPPAPRAAPRAGRRTTAAEGADVAAAGASSVGRKAVEVLGGAVPAQDAAQRARRAGADRVAPRRTGQQGAAASGSSDVERRSKPRRAYHVAAPRPVRLSTSAPSSTHARERPAARLAASTSAAPDGGIGSPTSWSTVRVPARQSRTRTHDDTGSPATITRPGPSARRSSAEGGRGRGGGRGVRRARSRAHCRFARREDRRCALPGRLRRAADRPPADGHPGADDQGRRVGAGALRRRVLQAAQLDVAAVHVPRGQHRGRPARVDGDRGQDRRHPAHPHRGGALTTPATTSASTPGCRRTASRSTSRSCSPSTPPRSPTASRSSVASSRPRSARST